MTRTDRTQKYVERKVDQTAKWFDSFFDDPNYIAEDASTRLRVRPEIRFQSKDNAQVRIKLAAKIHLPNLSRKASLVVGGDDGTGDFEDSLDDTVDDPTVGLQVFGKDTRRWNTSLTAGVKFGGLALFAGPRVRFLQPIGKKSLFRFVQTLRWFTDNGWDSRSRFDFDHRFGGRFFFRQTIDGRWRADKHGEEGFRTRVSTSITQRLQNYRGIQYEWFTIFHTQPDNHVNSTTLSVRFRKRSRRKEWLFYEIVPQLAFQDKFDMDPNPGIRLRIEVIFGKENKRKQKSDEGDVFR